MSYKQLVKPNLSVKGRVGWCLSYAKDVFGAPAMYNCAWDAWTHAKYRHTGNPPSDASTVMWYSYTATLTYNGKTETKNWGHVTVNVPRDGIYSSPYSSKYTHNVMKTIAEVERLYGVKYVGWSEDINTKRVVTPGESMSPQDKADLALGQKARKDGWQNQIVTLNKTIQSMIKTGADGVKASKSTSMWQALKDFISKIK